MSTDLDRLIDRCGIAADVLEVAERLEEIAVREARWLAAPRVVLADERRRVVRVVNAPREARKSPPTVLLHGVVDVMTHRRNIEPVARLLPGLAGAPDIDYQVVRTGAGDELLALLHDEVEPSVAHRSWGNGATDFLTTFDG
jgi:hypothetical protein